MPNSFFKFKQFTIHQDKCAMKVCTDSCLFGAIVANDLSNKQNVLDIGSGTGLLSLMYAQKNSCDIDTVEIDMDAYEQSRENMETAIFNTNINVHHTSIADYFNNKQYDLIICNPPFYKNSLKSNDEQRNKALHNDELTYEILFSKVDTLLAHDGIFALLIPYHLTNECLQIAGKHRLFCNKNYGIKQTEIHDCFRNVLFFSRALLQQNYITLAIKDKANQYTNDFVNLLKDYYLFL